MADRSASGPEAGGPERVGGRRRHVPKAGYRKPPSRSQARRRRMCAKGEHSGGGGRHDVRGDGPAERT